ncbi:MAG: YfhO family protein [Chloroflexi bacterium]|nr:YfhO family protein [Chloroflexota bacterium]
MKPFCPIGVVNAWKPLTHRVYRALIEHRHFFIVVTLLTLVTTFPAIIYIFKTDVYWLPSTARDIYTHVWDAWYGQLVLTGQADRPYTNLMFYPEGIDLGRHSYVLPNILAVIVFQLFLPLSNSFSLAWLLIIISSALAAYIYLLWFFEDKWIALFGAVVFAFSPHVASEPHHPDVTYIVPIPLVLYCFHRGIREQRTALIILAGVLTGLTSMGLRYTYAIVLVMLGLYVCAFALVKWRQRRFWRDIALLVLVGAVSSAWGVYPLLRSSEVSGSVLGSYGGRQYYTDAISFLVNHRHPLFGPLLDGIFQTPEGAKTSATSFLGYLPLLLVCIGLINGSTRRLMLPWALLGGVFLILRLGPVLTINGVAYPDILLPKHFLDQVPPGLFRAFVATDQFMAGAVLPLAILTCFGLVALRIRAPFPTGPAVILALVLIVAFEYYMPIREHKVPQASFDFIDWLKLEEEHGEIRLINIPMGRTPSLVYKGHQAVSGYPHSEGAISRTPESAYDYIRASYLLRAWLNLRPINCEISVREFYLADLAKLEADGFSHVVFHRPLPHGYKIGESFEYARPSYEDQFVSIYRLEDLRESCPAEPDARQRFAEAYAKTLLNNLSQINRHGIAVIFAPNIPAADLLIHHTRSYQPAGRAVLVIASDEQENVIIQSSKSNEPEAIADTAAHEALWLVNLQGEFRAERTPAFQDWFTEQFHFCKRFHEEAQAHIDLYLSADIPCSAMDESSALEVQYDSGVRLHNISHVARDEMLHFYTAWTNNAPKHYSFSLQFFDESGRKTLQYDSVIDRDLLSTHKIDASSLPAGAYSVKLIVYDFETQISQGGLVAGGGQRFERELDVARIEL